MSKTLQCPKCGYTRPRPIDPEGHPIIGAYGCPHGDHGVLVDRDTFRREDIATGPDVIEVTSQEGAEIFEGEAVTFDAKAGKAYINVRVVMDLVDVIDTPTNCNLTLAPLAAAVMQWGFEPVLIEFDD